MPIRFSCSACGKKLKVKDEYAGRQSRCPGCGWGIIVPLESNWKEGESPGTPIAASPPPLPAVSMVPAPLGQVQTREGEEDEPQTREPSKSAASRSAQTNRTLLAFIATVGFILIAGFAVVALHSSSRKPIEPSVAIADRSERSGPETLLVPADLRQSGSPNTPDARYRFLSTYIGEALVRDWGSKDVFAVRLSRKVSKTALEEIAREIESNKPRNPRTGLRNVRTIIRFYLPEVDAYGPDGTFGAPWAVADFNGPLKSGEEVEIFGFTIDEELKAIAKQPPPPGDLVGEWIDDSIHKSLYLIYRRDGVFYFSYGGRLEEELAGFGPEPFRLYERKKRSSDGDYYRINDSDNLELRNDNGLIAVARRVR